MKRTYVSPIAEKLVFNYADTIVASPGGHHGDVGIGVGKGGGCDHEEYHLLAKQGGNGDCTNDSVGGGHPNGAGHSSC